MAKRKQVGEQAEMELGQALVSMDPKDGPREICPAPDLLRRFAAGAVSSELDRNQVLNHLAVCPRCVETVVRLRSRRRLIRRSAIALIATLLIAALALIWLAKPPSYSAPVAVADLRDVAPTRSNEPSNMGAVRVAADTRQLVIILPESRESGGYEIEIRSGVSGNQTLLHSTANAIVKDHTLELIAGVDFSKIPPGTYRLCIRHDNSHWEYISILRQ